MNISFRSLLIFLIIDFPIQLLSQTTYFVSTSGSNNNNGSNTNPFETIQYAIDISSPQDTIQVDTGTYYENLICNKSITIMSSDPLDTNVVLNTIINGSDTASCLWIVGSNPIIDGLTIEHGFTSGSPGGGGIHIQGYSNAIIDHCYIQNNSGPQYTWCNGIQIEEGSSIVRNTTLRWNTSWRYTLFNHLSTATFENLHVYGNISNGPTHENASIMTVWRGTKIRNCIIRNNQSNGIGYSNGGNYPQFERSINHSLVNDNSGYGIFIVTYGQGGLNQEKNIFELSNSIIGNNTMGTIGVEPFPNNIVPTYSVISEISHSWIENDFDTIGTSSKVIINIDSTNIIDSVFLETDLTLTPNSPAIGSGDSNLTLLGYTITSPSLDYTGNNRPLPANSNPDMGPFESVLGVPICNPQFDTLSISICDSMVSYSGTKIWSQTGIYLDTLTLSSGCDSILVIDLTVKSLSRYYVSVNGDNSNLGGLNSPKKDIQHCIDYCCEGDTIIILPGTYYENLICNKSITIMSSDPLDTNVVLNTIINGSDTASCLWIVGSNPIIDGLTIEHGFTSGSPGGGGIHIQGYSNAIIDHCYIQNNSGPQYAWCNGIQIEEGSSIVRNTTLRWNTSWRYTLFNHLSTATFENLHVYGNISNGPTHENASIMTVWRGTKIRNCIIRNNQSNGIGYSNGGNYPQFERSINHSLVNDNSGYGIFIVTYGQGGLNQEKNIFELSNSIIGNNTMGTIGVEPFPNNIVPTYSVISEISHSWIENDFDTIGTSSKVIINIDSTNIIDSVFLETDLTLTPNSPAIGSGDSNLTLLGYTITSPSLDYTGNNRPLPANSNPDMGPFESVLGVPLGVIDIQIKSETSIVRIYPNPTKGTIQLKSSDVPYNFEIKDVTGKLIKSHLITETNHSIDLSSLENGLYIYSIVKDNTRYSDKLILSK